ncbi:MAG: hypothetical protein WAL03_23625, partial [Pseudolabrys sp.]
PRGSEQVIVPAQTSYGQGVANVRFGSKADMCSAKRNVRFPPESRHEVNAANVKSKAVEPRQ